MFTESLSYLRSSEEWVKTALVGGLLVFFGFLVVPAILLFGYLMRVLRGRMRGDDAPPAFDEWGDMLRDGAYGFAVALVYGLVPGVVGVALVAVAVGAFSGDAGGAFVGLAALAGGLLLLALSLAVAYVLPAALSNYAEKGRFGAAFSYGDLRPVLFSGKYAAAWAVGLAVVLVAGAVAGALNVVPVLGTFVGAFVSFYALVAAYYCFGTAWGELQTVETRDENDAVGERPVV